MAWRLQAKDSGSRDGHWAVDDYDDNDHNNKYNHEEATKKPSKQHHN